jgi:hypothetical protein
MGLGLMVSTVARTEEAAVAALPMLILPQILLSALATGDAKAKWQDERAFRPVVVMLSHGTAPLEQQKDNAFPTSDQHWRNFARTLTDWLSLVCYTRPTFIVLTRPPISNPVPGYWEHIWLGDLLHLCILVLGTYAAMWWTFLKYESHWPALAGI